MTKKQIEDIRQGKEFFLFSGGKWLKKKVSSPENFRVEAFKKLLKLKRIKYGNNKLSK